MNDRDLTRSLTELAGTVTDRPQRLTSVHRRIRHLRRRRVALQGTAVTGVLVLAGAAYRAGPAPVEMGSTGSPGSAPGTTIAECVPFAIPAPEDPSYARAYATDRAVIARPPVGDELVFVVPFTDEDPPPPGFRSRELTFTIDVDTKFFEGRVEVPRPTLVEGQVLFIEASQHGDKPWWISRIGLDPDVETTADGERRRCMPRIAVPPGTTAR